MQETNSPGTQDFFHCRTEFKWSPRQLLAIQNPIFRKAPREKGICCFVRISFSLVPRAKADSWIIGLFQRNAFVRGLPMVFHICIYTPPPSRRDSNSTSWCFPSYFPEELFKKLNYVADSTCSYSQNLLCWVKGKHQSPPFRARALSEILSHFQ